MDLCTVSSVHSKFSLVCVTRCRLPAVLVASSFYLQTSIHELNICSVSPRQWSEGSRKLIRS